MIAMIPPELVSHGIGHVIGADQGSWYGFWSGLGNDLGEIAFIGAALGVYRKHNCHVHGCWRIAKQQVDGTSWIVCHKHHPDGKPTPEKLAAYKRPEPAAGPGERS
jgi:hypothetical protein